jgi:hypothetical protein
MIFSNKVIILLFIFFSLNAAAKDFPTFNVGYLQKSLNNYSKKDLKISMDIWIKSITKEVGYDAHMFFYTDPKKAAKDLYAGKIDFITGFPLDFVKYFDISKLEDGFTGGFKKSEQNKFVILSKKENPAKSLRELKNVKVGIQQNDEIMHLYTKLKIPRAKIVDYKKRSKIVLDLFFSKIDVAIVPLHNFELECELNPQIAQQIKILKHTEYVANGVGFYRKGFPKKERQNIYEKGEQIFHTKRGEQMMIIYKMETLSHTPVTSLQNAQKLYDTYLKQKNEKK